MKAVGHIILSLHTNATTPGGNAEETTKPVTCMYLIEEYIVGLIPLGVFILTCGELTLLAFLNFFSHTSDEISVFETISIVLAALYMLFTLTYIVHLVFSTK